MKKHLVLLLSSIYSLVFIATGCSSGGDSAPPTAIPLDTSLIRTYQQGDSLTATVTLRDTSTGQTAAGTVTVTIGTIVTNPFGIDCRSIVFAGTLTGPAGSIAYNFRYLFYQDASNSLYECGEFNDALGRYVFLTDTITTPNGIFLEEKSPVQIGDSTSGVIFFDDGTWEDCTRTVIAKENVSVPLGLYESYKVNHSCSNSDGTTSTGTVWTVPSIFDLKDSSTGDGISGEILVTSFSFR